MPSINELFASPGSEAETDFELDIDKLMGEVDKSIASSTRLNDPGEREASSEEGDDALPPAEVPPSDEQIDQPSGETAGPEESPAESAAEETISPPLADPLGLLPPERRAALLAIDEVVNKDPAKRDRVLAALRDEVPTPPTVPTLPDDIEEGSVAHRLWLEAQDTKAQLAQIGQTQLAQSEAFAKQAAAQAADAAGTEFAARYSQLEDADIVRIAQHAGSTGLAARLANGADDLKGAYLQALESTLWTEPTFRAKVTGPALTEALPVAEQPATKERKRKLTALSSAASPTSAPAAPKSPLETRHDGRLTPQSRMSVVKDMASQLNRSQNEGNY